MNIINIKIINSNLNYLLPNNTYKITLIKYISQGSYGVIFLTNFHNYIAKIIDEHPPFTKNNNFYSDLDEPEVIDKIIKNKSIFNINCSDYAFGQLEGMEDVDILNVKDNKKDNIFLYVNPVYDFSPVESEVIDNRTLRKFTVFEENNVIFMPLYVKFDSYVNQIGKRYFYNTGTIVRIIQILIDSYYEMEKINLMNIDLKKSNIMVDKHNNIKIIDFGIVKDICNKDKFFTNKEKYYVWPNEDDYTYSELISYMICIFVFDFLFDIKIYEDVKQIRNMEILIDRFKKINYLSDELRELITNIITKKMPIDQFKELIYCMDSQELPSPYKCILNNEGISLSNKRLTIFN